MKKTLALLSLLICFSIHAQVLTISTQSKDFAKMKSSKTMVVLIGDTAFDNAVKRAVDKYWKFTGYEYVSINDVDKYIPDETKSFMLPFVIRVTYTHDAGSGFSDYSKIKSWYAVIQGGKKRLEKYGDDDAIAISPFNYYGNEKNYKDCAYRMDYMIKGLNDAFVDFEKQGLTGSVPKIIFNCIEEINKKTVSALSKKTLIINKDDMSWATKKPVIGKELFEGAEYKYKYKLVSDAEFKTIMKGNSSEYLCFFPAIEVNKHMLVYDPSTKKTVYYGWAMQGLKVKEKDIKSMEEGKY